jgi:hypothetical protein
MYCGFGPQKTIARRIRKPQTQRAIFLTAKPLLPLHAEKILKALRFLLQGLEFS